MTKHQKLPARQQVDNEIAVRLAEFEQLRAEVIETLKFQQQHLVLILGSVSVAVPLLLGLSTSVSASIVAGVLYALTIVYAVLGMNYSFVSYELAALSKYIHEYIEPALNQVAESPDNRRPFYYETFIRLERRSVFAMIVTGLGPTATALLIFLPGALTLFVAQYMRVTAQAQLAQQTGALQSLSTLLVPVSIIAWVTYALAIVSFACVLLYQATRTEPVANQL